jgi:uncharacterized protein YijF (DUF1287 family)
MRIRPYFLLLLLVVSALGSCREQARAGNGTHADRRQDTGRRVDVVSPTIRTLVDDAVAQSTYTTGYDPSYVAIAYPGGDVPRETGVCADVVVRAFRSVGIDLQKSVHEDMAKSFSSYPKLWGLAKPDANIDHRRVANLMKFFERAGKSLPVTTAPAEWAPGDIVAWKLPGGRLHIGMVVDRMNEDTGTLLVCHNVGGGTSVEDVLFRWEVIGRYRYF